MGRRRHAVAHGRAQGGAGRHPAAVGGGGGQVWTPQHHPPPPPPLPPPPPDSQLPALTAARASCLPASCLPARGRSSIPHLPRRSYSPNLSRRCTHLAVLADVSECSDKLHSALRNQHKWGLHIVELR